MYTSFFPTNQNSLIAILILAQVMCLIVLAKSQPGAARVPEGELFEGVVYFLSCPSSSAFEQVARDVGEAFLYIDEKWFHG
jgi:hypothetical protein